jgi:hypothetical protein
VGVQTVVDTQWSRLKKAAVLTCMVAMPSCSDAEEGSG